MRLVELALQAERARDLRPDFLRLRGFGRPPRELGAQARFRHRRLAEIPPGIELRREGVRRLPPARWLATSWRALRSTAMRGGQRSFPAGHGGAPGPRAGERRRHGRLPLARSTSCPADSPASRARAFAPARRWLRASRRACAARSSWPVQGRSEGVITMQSTGQGGTHSAHPVHNAESTVCMRFAAPTIASTGHASMHSVQPMHCASSMRATACNSGEVRLTPRILVHGVGDGRENVPALRRARFARLPPCRAVPCRAVPCRAVRVRPARDASDARVRPDCHRAPDQPPARAGIPALARQRPVAPRGLAGRAGAAGADALRRDLLSAHVELGYGDRPLRQVHDGDSRPLRRQGHAVPGAADRAAPRPLGRRPRQPTGTRRLRPADAGQSSRATRNSASRSRPKARAAAYRTGNRASTGSRALPAYRSRWRTSTIRAARSASAATSSSPAMSRPT